MEVGKLEVRSIRIWKDGWRFICPYHDEYIKKRKLKPTLALIYGPKKRKKKYDKSKTKYGNKSNRQNKQVRFQLGKKGNNKQKSIVPRNETDSPPVIGKN